MHGKYWLHAPALVHRFSAPRDRFISPASSWVIDPSGCYSRQICSRPFPRRLREAASNSLRPSRCVESIQPAKTQFPEVPAAETVYTIVRNVDYQIVDTDPSQAH